MQILKAQVTPDPTTLSPYLLAGRSSPGMGFGPWEKLPDGGNKAFFLGESALRRAVRLPCSPRGDPSKHVR